MVSKINRQYVFFSDISSRFLLMGDCQGLISMLPQCDEQLPITVLHVGEERRKTSDKDASITLCSLFWFYTCFWDVAERKCTVGNENNCNTLEYFVYEKCL